MFINKKLYKYRLKDGRWGDLSRSLMAKAGSICSHCKKLFRYNLYLTIHHKYYIEDRDPWDYPIDAYQVLCLKCHASIDGSTIKQLKNSYKNEMSNKKFIITKKYGYQIFDSSCLPFNKFFCITLYGEIIDCGYKTHFDNGDGRFDYELIIRELNNNDKSYSRFRLPNPKIAGYRSCIKIEDYITEKSTFEAHKFQ